MNRRGFLFWGSLGMAAQVLGRSEGGPKLILVPRNHLGRRWTCLEVNPSDHRIELYSGGPSGPLRSFRALTDYCAAQGQRVVAAMNAGMFETDGAPVGWCVAEGKTVQPANLLDGNGNFFLKPNGVFAISATGAAIRETTEASKDIGIQHARLVTQSGPLMLINGVMHHAFNAYSKNRVVRNAIGVTASGNVWWAISEDPVSFHETAAFFRDGLRCPNALFLDGQVSRLHAPSLGRDGGASLLGPLLAVTEPI